MSRSRPDRSSPIPEGEILCPDVLRRLPAVLLPLVLVAGGSTACGDDAGDSAPTTSDASAFGAVTIAGDVGEAPEGRPGDGQIEGRQIEAEDPRRGRRRRELKDGDQVAHPDLDRQRLHPGEGLQHLRRRTPPELLTVDDAAEPGLRQGARGPDRRLPGRGHRLRRGGLRRERQPPARASATRTPCCVVVDLISVAGARRARRDEQEAPSWAPELVDGKDGDPTGLDFTGTPKPDDKLRADRPDRGRRAPRSRRARPITVELPRPGLRRQEAVRRRATAAASPRRSPIGTGGVVKGWDKTLVGRARSAAGCCSRSRRTTATARQGNPQAGIKGTDTLYFVVDILAAELSRRGRDGGAMSGDGEERAAAQPAHHAARPAALRLQGPDPRDPLPGLQPPTAFEKMFERDKEELRSLGVPIEVGQMDAYFDDEPGYRIRPDEFALPDIELDRRRGRGGRPGHQGLGARPAGRGHHRGGAQAHRASASPSTSRALDIVEPRLGADEPSFDVFWEATQERTPVEFDYRRSGAAEPTHPAPPAVGRGPLLRPLVRRRLRHRPRARSGSSGSPGSRARPAASASPASYDVPAGIDIRDVARRLAPPRRRRAGDRAGPHAAPATRCAAAPTRSRPDVAGPDDATGWDRLVLDARRQLDLADEVLGLRPRRRASRRPRRCATRGRRPARRRRRGAVVSAATAGGRQGPGRPAAARWCRTCTPAARSASTRPPQALGVPPDAAARATSRCCSCAGCPAATPTT